MSKYESIENKEILKQIHAHQSTIILLSNEIQKLREQLDLSSELVSKLETSVRTANCLQNQGIETIGQLICYSANDLIKTKNFGRKSLNEIRDLLKERGLFLKDDCDFTKY